jgi:membrane protease YdiL (CAAX protease family)
MMISTPPLGALRRIGAVLVSDGWFLAALAAGPAAMGLMRWAPALRPPPTHSHSWYFLLTAVILSPVVEELLFRGTLQPLILQTRWGPTSRLGLSQANIAVSVAFASLHLLNHPPAWAMAVFFPSVIFGLFRDRYEAVWPALLLHITYNACYFATH